MTSVSSPVVSLQRCPSYHTNIVEPSLERLLEPLGGMGAFVKPGQRVLLKANLLLPRPVDAAITTHPGLLRAVALEVRKAGGTPVIGDSPAFGSAQMVAEACGIAAMAREIGVEIIDLGENVVSVPAGPNAPFRRLPLGREAVEADVVINLPKLKSHGQMGLSMAVKNLYGTVGGKRKTLYHFRTGDDMDRFSRLLVSIARAVKPALHIVDGIVSLERSGPTEGDPRNLRILAASSDPVALDRVLIEILGENPESIATMTAARKMSFGVQELESIRIAGESISALRVSDYVHIAERTPIGFTFFRIVKSLTKQVAYLAKNKIKAKVRVPGANR